MRNSERRRFRNHKVKSSLKTLEKNFLALSSAKPPEAAASFNRVASALDKAAKAGVIHWAKADRKKSRLAARLRLQPAG